MARPPARRCGSAWTRCPPPPAPLPVPSTGGPANAQRRRNTIKRHKADATPIAAVPKRALGRAGGAHRRCGRAQQQSCVPIGAPDGCAGDEDEGVLPPRLLRAVSGAGAEGRDCAGGGWRGQGCGMALGVGGGAIEPSGRTPPLPKNKRAQWMGQPPRLTRGRDEGVCQLSVPPPL